jgi:hypothetical protein
MPLPLAAISAASSVVTAGTSIVGAITGTSDAAKRRMYEQNLALLNVDEKRKLEKLLRDAGSEQARQQVLAATLGQLGTARIEALSRLEQEREKTKKTVLILSIVGGVVLIGGLIFVLKK